ncbi:MAG: xylulokinase [Acidobacteriota bacterium]
MWLGIDIGTGGSRALLVDGRGHQMAAVTIAHEEMRMEHPQWAEQRPEDWAQAAAFAVRGVLKKAGISGDAVRGVGLSGQMHGLVMLDANDAVIRPSLIWCDQRSQQQVDFIHSKVGRENVLKWIANPVLTGFTLPKLLWVRDNEPQHFERLRKMLLPKDYVRFCLTGEYATDVADASGTAVFDVVNRGWSVPMMDALGLDRSILPRVDESSEVSSSISRRGAELTGLKEGTPVVAGAGDQAASAVGNGIVETGIVSCTLGSSGVVFAHMDQVAYDPGGRVHTFCHAVPGKWHVMGVTQGAGLSLQWLRKQLMPDVSYDEMTREAATAPAGCEGLVWLPYLMGERTPHLDARARGGWIGLTAKHTRADMIRAVIEGVTFSQRDGLEIVEGLGVRVGRVRASGGGARSLFWRQMLADAFGRTVATLESQEGSAQGAALLAMVGTRQFATVAEACGVAVREVETLEPREAEARVYASAYKTYRELYPALRGLWG